MCSHWIDWTKHGRGQFQCVAVLIWYCVDYYYCEIKSNNRFHFWTKSANNKESRGKKICAHEKNLNRFEKSHFNYTIQLQLAQILIMPSHLSLLLLWPVYFTQFCGHRFTLYRTTRHCVRVWVCFVFSLLFNLLKTDANLLRCQIHFVSLCIWVWVLLRAYELAICFCSSSTYGQIQYLRSLSIIVCKRSSVSSIRFFRLR